MVLLVNPTLSTQSLSCFNFRFAHPRARWVPCTKVNGRVSYKHVGVSVSSLHQSCSEPPHEPLWLTLVKDFVWSTRSVFSFMGEQPSQVKYIEWPSFTNTLKTATLSLLLVAVFIVALSSVDSALSYLLALMLRKAP